MKRVLLAVAILMGSASVVVPTLTITASAQTCDPNSPCLYSGEATTGKAGVNSKVTIVVKMDKRGKPVAEVDGKGTYYVFLSQTDEEMSYGNYYINIDGKKYYFTM